MTKEVFREMPRGTRLLVGDKFLCGEDDNIKGYLGTVITFDYIHNDKWVYFQECSDGPFRHDEIRCIAEDTLIDDKQYEPSDIQLLFGEVSA